MFHNGNALDAAAVKENLDAFVASALTGAAFNNVEKIDGHRTSHRPGHHQDALGRIPLST